MKKIGDYECKYLDEVSGACNLDGDDHCILVCKKSMWNSYKDINWFRLKQGRDLFV